MTLAVEAQGVEVTTVEGLMEGEELGEVQQAFVDKDAFQCGYCTSGQIMAVEGFLRKTAEPSEDEIRRGCSGNLCRCGAYQNILALPNRRERQKKLTKLSWISPFKQNHFLQKKEMRLGRC